MEKNVLKNGIEIYKFENFNEISFIEHGFTNRINGISPKPFNSLNFGVNTGDKIENVNRNIELLIDGLNASGRKIILTNQIHDDRIHIVEENEEVVGEYKICQNTDGLVTEFTNSILLTFYADCNPIFFVDKKNKIVAVSHAGWKGTLIKFSKTTVEFLKDKFNSKPEDIIAGIGPSAGGCCYEVGEEIVIEFKKNYDYWNEFIIEKSNGKYMIDLKLANKLSIMESGVPSENIEVSHICTICNEEFFSHRREKITGRMAGFIYIK